MAPLSGKWTKVAASAAIRRSSQVAGVLDKRLVIYGGELKPREPVDNKIYLLDLAGDAAITAAESGEGDDAPTPRVSSASTVLGDSLYLFSGRGGPSMKPLDEAGALWSLSLSSDAPSWRLVSPATGSPVPSPRSYHAMTSGSADTVYLHAGCPAGDRLSDLWGFHIGTARWKQLADAPGPGRGGTSIAHAAGKLYRMSGFDGKTELGGAIDIYDIQNDTWSTFNYKADNVEGPEARSVNCLAALSIGGRTSLVTFAGERDPSSLGHEGAGKMLGDVWVWDVEDRRWNTVDLAGEPPSPRGWFAADVVTLGGRQALVVHGGLGEDNVRLDDVWILEF